MSDICEHCGEPIEGTHICGCTFTNTVEIDAAELATLRTRLAEVEAENGRLRESLRNAEQAGDFQQVLAAYRAARRATLAQTTEKDHDDDT